MTSTGRRGNHRSKKKRLVLVLAPVAAVAVAIPLMSNAGAATSNEVTADCSTDSPKLENCEFVDVQVKRNSFGPNERVSDVSDNCGVQTDQSKSFDVAATVTRTVTLEDGFTVDGNTTLAGSIISVGGKFSTSEINLKTDATGTGFSFGTTDDVFSDHIGFFMWSHRRTDVSGFLKATYKEEQDGKKVFFSPSEGATDIHVFYPQLLKNGTPNGRLWLRNVKCGTPEADEILKSAGGSTASTAKGAQLRADVELPGFKQGGPNITDVEIPESEIPAP
ncbi:hypothetical protein [Streptomyces europaeiscabiei]|uniref:hypothetical protein n=1 Tax=Streptomyces europaeiscabiei TaxID=146819 RepID=UPI002E179ED3